MLSDTPTTLTITLDTVPSNRDPPILVATHRS